MLLKFGASPSSSPTWGSLEDLSNVNDNWNTKVKEKLALSQYPSMDSVDFKKGVENKFNSDDTKEMTRMHRQNRIDNKEVELRMDTNKPKRTIKPILKRINERLVKMYAKPSRQS